MFPLRMDDLEIYGERPAVGTEVACRIKIDELERHRVRVHAEFIRPDGTVWMRIHDWEDWRFHWPGRYRDAFRQPRDYMVGEELPLDGQTTGAKAVWLEPPADMGRPVWRDVLEHTQLGPMERATYLAEPGPDQRRSQRLWGRIAAKEAARRLWKEAGDPATYPADLAIVAGEHGRPLLTRLGDRQLESTPAISIAHTEGIAVALAAARSRRPGGYRRGTDRRTRCQLSVGGIHAGRALSLGSPVGLESRRVDGAVLVRQGSRGQGVGTGVGRWSVIG